MPVNINIDQNLSEYLDTSTSSMNMSNAAKTLTVSTGKPFKNSDTLEFRPVGQPLPGGIQVTVSTYTTATGAMTTTSTLLGYSEDTPVQELALATGTINTWTNPGLGLAGGENIRIARVAAPASWGTGTVTSYNNTTGELVLNITAAGTTGTFSDMVMVSDGTFTDWKVSYAQNNAITVNTNATLTIDSAFAVPVAQINASDRGKILIKNTSTTNLLKLQFQMYASTVISVTGNSTLEVQGDFIQIGTGNNTASQTINISSYDIPYPTYVEVETGNGTGIYNMWHIVLDGLTGQAYGYDNFMPDYYWGTGELGNVFFFDADSKILRTGDGTNGNKIATGAKVRMPNIYMMGIIPYTYATTSHNSTATGTAILGVVDTRYVTTSATAWQGIINNEKISASTRSGKYVSLLARAQIGTTGQNINPGNKIWRRNMPTVSGVEPGKSIRTDAGGTVNIDKAQLFGVYLYLANYKSLTLKNYGSDHWPYILSSTNDVSLENFTKVDTHNHSYAFYFENITGEVSVNNVIASISLIAADPAAPLTPAASALYRCTNVVKCENVSIFIYGWNTTVAGGFTFDKVTTKDPNYAINNIKVLQCRITINNSSNLKFKNLYHGRSANTAPIYRSTSTTASATTDQFTTGTTYGPTTNVPPTGVMMVPKGGTYPTTVPALANDVTRFCINTSTTTFKLASTYRNALNNIAMDLTTNGGTNMHWMNTYSQGSAIVFAVSSNILVDGIYSIGCGGTTFLLNADSGCSDIEVYNIDYDGAYEFQYIVSNSGKNFTVKNAKVGEVLPSAIAGANGSANGGLLQIAPIGNGTFVENVRAKATGLSFVRTTGYGTGYTSNSSYNFLTGAISYWGTNGGTAQNMKNVNPFMNLVDPGYTPTTGTLAVSSASITPDIVITGSAFFTNQGRIGFLAANDTATYTSSRPIRGITSFQNVTPVHNTSSSAVFTYEFRLKTPLGAWSAWSSLTGANLSTALSSLTGYSANEGFMMSMKITATENTTRYYVNSYFPTNVDSTWTATDAYYTLVGVGSTEISEARKTSDDSLVTRISGGGRIDVPSGTEIYFIRKSASGIPIASTYFEPTTPVLGNNGEVQLYSGSEIQLADATQIVEDVWNQDISGITATNSAGKILKSKLSKSQFLGLK